MIPACLLQALRLESATHRASSTEAPSHLPEDDPQVSRTLLETPLPLALESMRGRPSLSFVGVVKMDEMHCDFSGTVSLHVHPRCILTRQLFAHNLCAEPIPPSKGRTELGIHIRLGDSNLATSSTSDIIVYGRPHPSSSVMQLCVAHVIPAPLPTALPKPVAELRHPRPDDPTPRKPPAGFGGIARIGLGMKRSINNAKVKDKEGDEEDEEGQKKRLKKERDVAASSLHGLGKNPRVGIKNDSGIFKIPFLPPAKAKTKAPDVGDVFDAVPEDKVEAISDLESQNKMFIKKAVVRLLTAAGVGKPHADFKEFFNQVYRGSTFALRTKMKTLNMETDQRETELVDRVTQTHITMYLGGRGLGVYLLQ
ncbi:hypothetical protein EW145_g1868 [Phellinidium pouzarii]|uniref:Sld7 C-terminal domain-containing protein n=1 Tax=Phellinidium pouzarii TaxID=167371 RepID=A0A4S4LDB9_9AGAM|nr:hypothetical protein EW145_g1868 [Phellinidium pouzarii]